MTDILLYIETYTVAQVIELWRITSNLKYTLFEYFIIIQNPHHHLNISTIKMETQREHDAVNVVCFGLFVLKRHSQFYSSYMTEACK